MISIRAKAPSHQGAATFRPRASELGLDDQRRLLPVLKFSGGAWPSETCMGSLRRQAYLFSL
jgi:hypothetical protein